MSEMKHSRIAKSLLEKYRCKNIFRLPVCILLSCLSYSVAVAQQYPIANGEITTCTGVFSDDGFGSSYSSADYIFTICPDSPGDVIQVQFAAFSLFTSPNPNNSDYLNIFDGDTPSANSLGNYTGNSLQGLPVTGTINNISGCLTFVFNPSNSSSGTFPGWEALISCTTPCAPPTSAGVIIDPAPSGGLQSIGVCLDQPVTFGDVGSSAQTGFNLVYYIWNWNDGTLDTTTTPSNIQHVFTEPGEYIVNLSVEDNNGCRNLNLDPLQILVSTIPIFNTDFDSPVCLNEPVTIDGAPIQSITWTALPPQVVAGQTYLADGAGFQYTSSLTFDFFEPDAILEDCNDFLDVFVNIEHSYLGDLGMSLECPNGTVVTVLDWGLNNGGGTFLGDAIDNDPANDPGIGFDYAWAPGQTNGNLDDQTSIPVSGGNAVPPGTYESHGDLCDLVGCPLNGDWTFGVSDNIGADNGYIFEWGINFNPNLFPDITTFTPIIGLGPDSSFWEGPNIVGTSPDGNTIDVFYTTPGFYEYTFFATNNFGCTFDTTITVEAIEGPQITAGPDLQICAEPGILQAGLVTTTPPSCNNAGGNFEYCFGENEYQTFTYCPDNQGDGNTFMSITFTTGETEFWDNVFIYDGLDQSAPLLAIYSGFFTGESVQATNPTGCITLVYTSDGSVSCVSGSYLPLEFAVNCQGGSNLIWSWSPADGLSNPNIQNPTVFVEQATLYTVTAYPADLPGCVISDQVLVAPDPTADPGIDADTTFCYNSPVTNLTNYLGGTPALNGIWTDLASGQTITNSFNPTQFPNGLNLSLQYEISNGICSGTSLLNVTILPASNNTCCQTNAFAGQNAVACGLTYQLNGSTPVGVGTWTGTDEVSFSDINDPNAIATYNIPGGGQPILTWTDSNGAFCEQSSDVQISFSDPLTLVVVPSDAVCFNQCSGTGLVIPDGGTVINGTYNYIWSSGAPGSIPQLREEFCTGVHKVVVSDNLGCTDSLEFVIGQPASQEIFTTLTQPLCVDSCNGTVTIQSAGAVEYSFDKQFSWIPENLGFKCAGTDTVYARNAVGCVIGQPITLNDPPLFTADFNLNPTTTTTRNTLISFQDISGPGPLAVSDFTFGNDPILATSTNSRMTTFRFPSDTAGVYPITLISANINGCTDTISRTLIINDDILWYIPNSFSANGDGINDIWRPVGNTVDVTNYRLEIFDRWGRKVFESTDFDEGWNGAVEGSSYYSDAGLFTYIIKLSSLSTEEKYEFTGFITLLR